MNNVNMKFEFPAPRAPRYRTLDIWRGIACLAVVVYHSALYYLNSTAPQPASDFAHTILRACEYGWQGVPVFFVISGYCIAATADRSRRGSGRIANYVTRRFWRIYPAYWAVLLLSVLLVTVVDLILHPGLLSSSPRAQLRPWWFSWSQWLGNLSLTETWRCHLFGSQRAHFVGQSWTLCYEEQFYLVIGLILVGMARRLFLAAVLVTLMSISIQMLAAMLGFDVNGFFFDGSWLMFASGILVYYHVNYAGRIGQLVAVAVLSVALVIALTEPVAILPGSTAAFAFALLIIGLRRWDGIIADCRLVRPLAWCGAICYSLYLVHGLLVRILQKALFAAGATSSTETLLITLPLCVCISLIAAHVFYVTIERRCLPSREPRETPESGLAPTGRNMVPQSALEYPLGMAVENVG